MAATIKLIGAALVVIAVYRLHYLTTAVGLVQNWLEWTSAGVVVLIGGMAILQKR